MTAVVDPRCRSARRVGLAAAGGLAIALGLGAGGAPPLPRTGAAGAASVSSEPSTMRLGTVPLPDACLRNGIFDAVEPRNERTAAGELVLLSPEYAASAPHLARHLVLVPPGWGGEQDALAVVTGPSGQPLRVRVATWLGRGSGRLLVATAEGSLAANNSLVEWPSGRLWRASGDRTLGLAADDSGATVLTCGMRRKRAVVQVWRDGKPGRVVALEDGSCRQVDWSAPARRFVLDWYSAGSHRLLSVDPVTMETRELLSYELGLLRRFSVSPRDSLAIVAGWIKRSELPAGLLAVPILPSPDLPSAPTWIPFETIDGTGLSIPLSGWSEDGRCVYVRRYLERSATDLCCVRAGPQGPHTQVCGCVPLPFEAGFYGLFVPGPSDEIVTAFSPPQEWNWSWNSQEPSPECASLEQVHIRGRWACGDDTAATPPPATSPAPSPPAAAAPP